MLTREWIYWGSVLKWVDGDTVSIDVELGFKVRMEVRFRLIGSRGGIDTYEKHDPDPAKRELVMRGWARAQELAPAGSLVSMRSDKAPAQTFERWLARLVTPEGIDVGDTLVAEGLALPWPHPATFAQEEIPEPEGSS